MIKGSFGYFHRDEHLQEYKRRMSTSEDEECYGTVAVRSSKDGRRSNSLP